MNIDPLTTALKEITETESLLDSLILSSERFDYVKAKVALKKLSRKMRELDKLRGEFQAQLEARKPNIRVIDFRHGSAGAQDARGN